MERCLFWLDRQPHDPPLNMAVDEAILSRGFGSPILRYYSWDRECVSIGYGQSLAVARRELPVGEYVRRWTGGGCVLHGNDMTFSIFFPTGTGWAANSARGIYCGIHRIVADLIRESLGLFCDLAGEGELRRGECCFRSMSVADVVGGDGVKLCGGAIRRTRWGVLYQGSLVVGGVEEDFFWKLAGVLFGCPVEWCPDGETMRVAERLVVEKYGTLGWLERIP